MSRAISKFILRLLGWEIITEFEEIPKKYVLIAMPHTSNWDLPIGLLVRASLQLDIKYIGKDSLFRPPFGWFFRWLGGYPVDRSKRRKYVDSVVDIFNSQDEFAITIAPEGTRSKVSRLKTGFYYIALGAGVPIIMVKLDWGNKKIVMSPPFFPTGHKEADFEYILHYYRGVKGRHPELGFV